MKNFSSLFALVCLLGTAPAHANEFAKIPLEELRRKHEVGEIVLLDVRGIAEWNEGRVKGSTHIPAADLLKIEQLTELQKHLPANLGNKTIYTHCHAGAGARANQAYLHLKKLGVQNVAPLKDGFIQFKQARFPIEAGPKKKK